MNLTHHFLIAMPGLVDPNFHQTLTYICEHNENGAMGLVVNRPMDLALSDILDQMDISGVDSELAGHRIFYGGPVETQRGFVLHQPCGDWQATLDTGAGIGVTTSRDILQALAEGRAPRHLMVTLGYAGWAGGQLEHELSQNAWLTAAADPTILFELPPEKRLDAAAAQLGIDMRMLSTDAGHA